MSHRNLLSTATPRAEVIPGVWLDARLALWLERPRILVVADLHWGYAASHRARGNLLPLWGDDQIAARLAALLADYRPAEMLWLGDILHAVEGRAGAEAFLRETSLPITLLAGNHDRRWTGARLRSLERDGFFFRHGDETAVAPQRCVEVVGHHHPALGWYDGAGTRLKLPALVVEPRRLILPAFSPWAAGTVWNNRLARAGQLWAIAPQRIFAVTPTLLGRAVAPA